ncbi:hypothetical protein P4233_20020 [Pseudomonas aeruginosa]|nr:hypothetical protein [Pseudomonas aeruginosa]
MTGCSAEPKSDAELIADLRDLQGTRRRGEGQRELMSLDPPILRKMSSLRQLSSPSGACRWAVQDPNAWR